MPVTVIFLQTGIRREPPVHVLFDYIDLESSSVSLAEWNWESAKTSGWTILNHLPPESNAGSPAVMVTVYQVTSVWVAW